MKKAMPRKEYVYPAIFHPNSDDGSYTVIFPDLDGCITEGKTLGNAIYMAQDALRQWIDYLADKSLPIPEASTEVSCDKSEKEFVNYVFVNADDTKAVRKTVSIPKWMDDEVSHRNLSLSKVLQDALTIEFRGQTKNDIK